MQTKYDSLKENLLKQLDEVEQDENIQRALNKNLPNSSEVTDFNMWLEGSKTFADDNKELLKSMVR